MYKFKVGDKITAPVSGRHFEVILPCSNDDGTIGYFSKVTGGGFKGDHTILWGETGLELVKPEPKFKVGDVVWFTTELGNIFIGTIEECFTGSRSYTIMVGNFSYSRLESELTKHNGPVIEVGDYVYSKEYGHGEVTRFTTIGERIYAHFNNTNERAEYCQVMKAPPKFKVGDKVDYYGHTCTIDKVRPAMAEDQKGVWCYNSIGQYEWALKLVEPKRAFKVGDVVVNGFGSKYTVVGVHSSGSIDIKAEGGNNWYCQDPIDFKLYVEPEPVPVVEPAKPEFKVGDVVRLKSGGPKMTVSRDNGELGWFCQWIDDTGHRGTTLLPAVIEKVY